MKQINSTQNTIKEIVKVMETAGNSRLPILSRFCLVSLILMTIGVGNVWGASRTFNATCNVEANPKEAGWVYVAQNAQSSWPRDRHEDSSTPSYTDEKLFTSSLVKNHTFNFYAYQEPAIDGYEFKGWATSASANTGSESSLTNWDGIIYKQLAFYPFSIKVSGTNSTNTGSASYYAIYAGILNNADNKTTASLDFGTINYGSSKELTITFKHAHAGQISSSITGTNSGDFSLKSGTTLPSNSVAQGTQTITVVFKPTCSGPSSATLALSGNNGGSMSISLSGTSTPYSSTISTTDGSVNVSVGSTPTTTNLDNRVTTNADGARTYSCNNSAVTISGNSFSATKQGTYTVNVSIAQGCKYAACSSSFVITVNRLPQTLTMTNGEVFATKDKNSPTTLDLSSLKTQTGNGAVTYELVAWPNAMNGNSAKDSCVINGKNFHAWVAGTYTLRAKAAVTDQYNAVTSANFTVTVKKNVTSISGTVSYNIMVDGSTAIASYSTSNTSYATPLYGNSHDFYYTISHSLPANAVTTGCAAGHASEVIGYTGSNHTITAYNAGTATLILTQKETDVYTGASKSFNVTVYKYNSVFSGVANLNTTVENTVTSGYVLTYTKPNSAYVGANHTAGTPTEGENSGNWYYVLGHKVTTNTQTDCPATYKNVAITYAAGTKTATGRNQGVDTVRLYQKETYKYNSGSTSFRVTVAKNGNAISYKWNNENHTAWSETMNFDEKASFTYSANNSVRPININQVKGVTPGDTIATYSTDTKKVTAYYNKGQAVWSLHQDENYKYIEANAKCTVTVAEMACETCYAYKSDPDNNVSKIGEIGWGVDSVAKVLTFDMKPSGTAAGNDALLSYQISGNWTEAEEITAPGLGLILYKSMDPITLNPHTTRLKFEMGGDIVSLPVGDVHTDDPKVDNIRVSRLTWLELNSTQTGKALDTLYIHKEIGEASKSGSFQLKISTCDTNVKLASNDSKVTLSETSIALATGSTYDGGYVAKNINVTYTCDKKDTTDAIISAYTKYEHKTFVVRAITKANDQEIVWKEGFEGDIVSLPVNGYVSITDAASASSGLAPVLYSTNNSAVIEIAADRESFKVISAGSATLTASQEGNDEYEPTEDTKTIHGTEKVIQSIVWDDTFTRSMVVGASKQMKASVDTLNTQTGAYNHSDARTAKLVYSCPKNNGVIEIVDSCHLHILAEGTTTVTASVEGDSRYEKASYTKCVSVRPASAGCESHSVYVQKDTILFYIYDFNMPELTKTITFSPDSGVPDKLNFSVHGVSYHRIGRAFFEGDIDVYQSTNNGATWAKLTTIDAKQDSTVNSGDIQLDSTATMLKFVRPKGGQGYHYIEDLVVSRRQFLTAVTNTINLGDVPAGSIRTDKISFNYSETKSTELNVTKGKGDETNNTLEVDELVDIECGSFGQGDLEFKFKPTKVGPWSQTVTIADSISTKTFTVTINANVTKGSQSIIWNPTVISFYTVQAAELEAQLTKKSNRNLDVSYSASNGIVSFSGSTPTIKGNGSVTIYADCGDTPDYKAADQVSHEFKINRTPTTVVTAPVIPTIYAGTSAASVVLNAENAAAKETVKNASVTGTYTITSPDVLNKGTYDVTITFTPDNTNLFAPSTVTIENVTVEDLVYTYTGNGTWTNNENWNTGSMPTGAEDVIVEGNVIIENEVTVNSLTIVGNGSVTTVDHGTLIVTGNSKDAGEQGYGDLYVKEGGEVILNGTLKVRDFTIASNLGELNGGNVSGKVDNLNKLDVNGDAYIDITLAPADNFDETIWYGFTLPFDVDAKQGVYRYHEGAVQKVSYMGQYATAKFSPETYINGGNAWNYYNGTLYAGVFYFLTVDDNKHNIYRFKKKADAPIISSAEMDLTTYGDPANPRANWNPVGNSMLTYANANFSGEYVQIYQNGQSSYLTIPKASASFVVGCPFFIQVTQNESLILTQADNSKSAFYAPRRAAAVAQTSYQVQIAADGERFSDQIFVSAAEDATDSYEIGRDLNKAGVGNKSAQMWINAYNQQLSVNEAQLIDGQAMFALTLFAPKTGEYTLSLADADHDGELYLTQNGVVIWNLSDGAYTAELTKGNNTEYGLLLKPNVHQVTTDAESVETTGNVQKFIMNGKLYILNNGTLYDGNGKKVQ